MKRLFPSFMFTLALLAALFALAASPQANAAQQAMNSDHDRLVSFDDPAHLGAVNGEVFIPADATGLNGIDRTVTVNAKSTAQTLGAFSPRTRSQALVGNGIEEGTVLAPDHHGWTKVVTGDANIVESSNYRTSRLTTVQQL